MHARINTIFSTPDQIEGGIAHLETTDRALVEATRGNRGLTTLADRQAGTIVALSYWDEFTRSSDAALTRARDEAAAAAAGDLTVEAFEVAAAERLSVPQPGAAVRMVRVQIEPSRIEDGVEFIGRHVLPRLRLAAGFCSAELLIDPQFGDGALVASWVTEDEAVRADAVLDQLRDETAERIGAKFPRTETYVLVRTSAPVG